MISRIDLCLDTLQKRIGNNKVIELQVEEGKLMLATCSFNPPATESTIQAFFGTKDWHVPKDYFHFLQKHNGATLFAHPRYAGGMELFSISSIPNVIEEYGYMFSSHCYPIGKLNAAMIYINSDISRKCNEYLFWQDCIGSEETALNLRMNFETFLDLFIVSQGSEFWLWPTFKPSL